MRCFLFFQTFLATVSDLIAIANQNLEESEQQIEMDFFCARLTRLVSCKRYKFEFGDSKLFFIHIRIKKAVFDSSQKSVFKSSQKQRSRSKTAFLTRCKKCVFESSQKLRY